MRPGLCAGLVGIDIGLSTRQRGRIFGGSEVPVKVDDCKSFGANGFPCVCPADALHRKQPSQSAKPSMDPRAIDGGCPSPLPCCQEEV